MPMELRDIEYFAVVAEHGHLGRAAAALGLSQPALSKSLQRLEAALAVKLVKRTTKGVALTAEGSVLLLRVRDLRLSLRNIAREIAEVSDGRAGLLRVGAGAAMAPEFLSSALSALLRDAPRTRLQVQIADNDTMVPALHDGELDVVVNFLRSAEGLVCHRLYEEQFVVCASARHPLAGRSTVPLAALAGERWALASSEPTLLAQRWLYQKFLDAGLRPPDIAFESRSAVLRLRMVGGSNLLTFASHSLVRQSATTSELAILPVRELAWSFPVAAIHRQEAYLPPALRRFVDVMRQAARTMRADR
jgi:DNA-binding transcriptional LysR family regulator